MKKTLIALAAAAAAGGAFAQSTVTLSGVVDVGQTYTAKVAPGTANWSIGRGNNNRLAFSVSEDLGGGVTALGNAQMRFEPSTGNAETSGGVQRPLFQGETRIGLRSGIGTIMFGRGLTALQAPNGAADPFGVTTVAGSIYAAGFVTDYAAGGEGRIDTGIFYTSPSVSGLTLSVSLSPRKIVSGGVASKTHQSLNALYAAGPLSVGLGNERNRANDSITQFYGTYNLGVATVHFSTARVSGGTAADRALVGAVPAPGVTTTANGAFIPSGATGGSIVAADGKIRNNAIGAVIPVSQALSARLGYSSWNGNGAPGQLRDSKMGAGLRYSLSKRTYIYTDAANWSRKNQTGAATNDALNNTRQTAFDFGFAHSF